MKHLRITLIGLCLAMLLSVPALASDCHEYSEDWFGSDRSDASTLDLEAWEPSNSAVTGLLDDYFDLREEDFTGSDTVTAGVMMASADEDTATAAQTRGDLIAELEGRINARITDAEVTRFVLDLTETAGGYEVEVYEWTFFDYDDLSDGVGGSDTAGYGTYHTITMEYDETGELVIVSDLYSEMDILGCGTTADLVMEAEPPEEEPVITYDENYDPIRAGIYANKWVTHQNIGSSTDSSFYNPAYPNLNWRGGDCANYVSQCMLAGNMTQTDGWYYKNGSHSSAWSYCPNQYKYFYNLGKMIWQPTDGDIYPGSLIYCNGNQSNPPNSFYHVIICVGYNSAGRPVINGHNSDRYMVPWDYAYATCYTTIQLTPYRLENIVYKNESLFTYAPEDLTCYDRYVNGSVVELDKADEAYMTLKAKFVYEGETWYAVAWGDDLYYVRNLDGFQTNAHREPAAITVPEEAPNRGTVTVTLEAGRVPEATLFVKPEGGTWKEYDISSGSVEVDVTDFATGYATFCADVEIDGEMLRSYVEYCWIRPLFNDVEEHWAEEIIYEAYDLELFNGTSATTFDPDGEMSRAMFVTVLGRMHGADPEDYENRKFTDVADGTYYTGYVAWAVETGVVNGVTESTFCPDDPVTRQQAAAMIHRYLAYIGKTLPDCADPAEPFTDMDEAADYAVEPIEAMRLSGIINGYPQGDFRPADSIKRAEAAKIFLSLYHALED